MHSLRDPGAMFQLANQFSGREDVPLHSHSGAELVFVTKGRCIIEVSDLSLSASAGTLLILPPCVPQIQRTLDFTRTTYVLFKASAEFWDHTPRTICPGIDSFVRRWMDDLATLHNSHLSSSSEVTHRLLGVVLEEINRHEQRGRSASRLHPAVVRASKYLDDSFTSPFDMQKIAEAAGTSTSHLMAIFRQQLTTSPLKYHRDLRMRHARKLLVDPYLNVKQVARACGYEDTSYFVRVFHEQVGTSPGQWRSRHHAVDAEQ